MKRRIARGVQIVLSIGTFGTILMLVVLVSRGPFVAPWVEREAEALALRLDQMISAKVDQGWVDARLETALAEDPRDWLSIDLILEVAAAEQISPDPALAARVKSAQETDAATLSRAKRCARCALDIAECSDLGTLAICNFPLELTPIGDANALRRNFAAWTKGDSVDDLEVGLAALGLAATGAILVTGGGSATLKAGAATLRVARRAGVLTKSFEAALLRQVRALHPHWSNVPAWLAQGGVDAARVLDSDALSRLGKSVVDLGRIHRATGSVAGTLDLLRHVDSPAEATRLARIAEAIGPRIRAAFVVLGKSRVFRATLRLSNEVIAVIVLIIAVVVQAAGLAASVVLNRSLRFATSNAENSMESLDRWMGKHFIEWRKSHVTSREWGWWNGRQYPWVLPEHLWEEGLWPGIGRSSDNSLPAYLEKAGVQKHDGVHNLKSSWMLCANLYFPFRASSDGGELFASFLRHHVATEILSLESIELEFAEEGALHPAALLGETGGVRGARQTSPDLGLSVNEGRGLVLVENKFLEHGFYDCSARKRNIRGRREQPGNPDPSRCNRPLAVVQDPAGQCHQTVWGRRYWEHLASVADRKSWASLHQCPAASGGYQLFRQQALAEGIAQSGKYKFVISAVAVDERNDALNASLKNSGLAELKQWESLFTGRAAFAVFSHQQWVGWVRKHDTGDRWKDWLSYVHARYRIGE